MEHVNNVKQILGGGCGEKVQLPRAIEKSKNAGLNLIIDCPNGKSARVEANENSSCLKSYKNFENEIREKLNLFINRKKYANHWKPAILHILGNDGLQKNGHASIA